MDNDTVAATPSSLEENVNVFFVVTVSMIIFCESIKTHIIMIVMPDFLCEPRAYLAICSDAVRICVFGSWSC